jgi:hypothetical protein
MNVRYLGVALGLGLACVGTGYLARAQQPAPPAEWQKPFDALRQQVQAMQKDLDEIKALLAPLRARQSPTPPADLVIDLGNRPVRGGRLARLTLIELTDYQ